MQIRSAPYRTVFSYISNVAIRIGDDILEIAGGGRHYVNGELQETGRTRRVGGYMVGSKVTRNGRFVYRVHLGDDRERRFHGQELLIREYKDWITVGVHHPDPLDFRDSVGLMGTSPHGTWLGRDGVTVHEDVNAFGSDWIVREDVDGDIFREPSPFPDKCHLPLVQDDTATATTEHRRLSVTSITREQAERACSQWVSARAMQDCIMDVLISEDLEMAANVEL